MVKSGIDVLKQENKRLTWSTILLWMANLAMMCESTRWPRYLVAGSTRCMARKHDQANVISLRNLFTCFLQREKFRLQFNNSCSLEPLEIYSNARTYWQHRVCVVTPARQGEKKTAEVESALHPVFKINNLRKKKHWRVPYRIFKWYRWFFKPMKPMARRWWTSN